MSDAGRFRFNEKVVTGGLLVLLGVLFILDNFRVIDAGNLWDYWPLFLIGPGIARLIQPGRPGQRIWGLILVAMGAVFLLRNLDILWIPFHRVWPFVLVVVGGYLICQTMLPRGPGSTGDGGAGPSGPRPGQLGPPNTIVELSEFALLGGGNRVVRTADFRGGTVSVIAGGFDIDLREAAMTGDSATIDVFVLMGGAVFRVPKDWNVVMRATPLMGGSENKARPVAPAEGPVKTLFISGFILIGGLEMKN